MALNNQDFEKLKFRLNLPSTLDNSESAVPFDEQQEQVPQPEKSVGFFQGVKQDFLKRNAEMTANNTSNQSLGSKLLQIYGTGAAFVGDVVKRGVNKVVDIIPESIKAPIKQGFSETIQDIAYQPLVKKGIEAAKRGLENYNEFKVKHPEAAKNLEAVVNIATLIPALKGAEVTKDVTTAAVRTGVDVVKNTTKKVVESTVKNLENTTKQAEKFVSNIKERISSPNVSDATRVSLNPMEALKGTGQDIKVSVGGKVKNLSEITPGENARLKVSTEKSINTFTKQAEKFKKDRGFEGGSPVEIVGTRTDKALEFADKKRQVVGQKMGDIEQKYADDVIDVSDDAYKTFVDIADSASKPSYGVNLQEFPVVKKLIEDFDNLEKNGFTIAERNKFVRAWDSLIRDAKDPFGNFKENATVYTKLQTAVNAIKKETVDFLSNKDKVYRDLRKRYAEHVKLNEIGDMLLGKEGAFGDRIKGAATVKRAIQSNSDAGARQFLLKLKELTGYDAIRDGDLALTAMENVGDYQGLSLLNVLKSGKGGVIEKVLEKGQDLLVGDKAKRVKNFIRK